MLRLSAEDLRRPFSFQADGAPGKPGAGLDVAAEFRRFPKGEPAKDWVVTLTNEGKADSPVLSDILPLDITLKVGEKDIVRLHYAKGSQCRMDDFLPMVEVLGPKSRVVLAPEGGRSSKGVLPFMNLHHDGGGIMLAVGWSGQWQATFERDGASLRVTAGMQKTNLRLRPGESVRTPRILMIPYKGEPEDGQNELRRALLAHYLPRIDGKLVMPPVAQCLQFYYYLTGKAGEEFELTALPKVAELGGTAYWLDACWYGQGGRDWWQEVGNWTVNRKRFPRGLKPISDAAHAKGMPFILWFEPARVRKDGELAVLHPEFVLRSPKDADNMLLDFGNPAARAHILDVFSRIIKDEGVDVYREDFNFNPLAYWQAADAPDRVGMTEIRYIEGHYAFWDELRRRFPKLWIDNCASGGRRIDLETLSRSLPLWASDFQDVGGLAFGMGFHVGDQCIKTGLARWVPLFGGGVWNFTPYSTRGGLIAGFTFGCHIDYADYAPDEAGTRITPNDVMAKGKTLLGDDFPMDAGKAAIAEWRSVREFFTGDFYPLLPITIGYHDWCAWQFHREDSGAGFAVFLRRHKSPFPEMEIALKRIDAKARYDVSMSSTYDESPRRRMSGRELMNLKIKIDERPGSILLRYAKAK